MKVVADANIIFSALIKDGGTRRLLLSDKLETVTPEYVLQEIGKHVKLLSKKSGLGENILDAAINILETEVQVIPKDAFKNSIPEARRITPDPDDTAYLALHQNIPLWSNDKKLTQQKEITVYTTKDLIKKYGILED